MFEDNSKIEAIKPQDVLDAGIEQLDSRFDNMDPNSCEKHIKNMKAERDVLKPFIETSQLNKWSVAALDLAKDDYRKELDAETDNGVEMGFAASKLKEIEKRIAEGVQEDAQTSLQSKTRPRRKAKLDGTVAKFRSSQRQR